MIFQKTEKSSTLSISLKLFVHKIYLNSQYNSNESHISISLFEIY